jgi:peroxiredoxin
MVANHEGKKVPQATFRTRANNEWKNVTSDEIFKGKTVALFALPGAFTPTCSSTHLPRYNELAPAFFANRARHRAAGVRQWPAHRRPGRT